MRQGVRLRHVRLSPRDARVTTPKYRTDTRACSCLGYWWRRSCNHFRAYREAVALVLAQDTFNRQWSPVPDNLSSIGVSPQSPRETMLVPIGDYR